MFLSSISHLTVANNLLNNLVLNVSVLIIKFADYMKIGSVVDNEANSHRLQDVIDQLVEWAVQWKIKGEVSAACKD